MLSGSYSVAHDQTVRPCLRAANRSRALYDVSSVKPAGTLPSRLGDAAYALARDLTYRALTNRPITRFITEHGARFGARRFVAGETIDDAVRAMARLEQTGFQTTVQCVGENVTTEHEAVSARDTICRLAMLLHSSRIRGYLSVKPTQMGLGISERVARENLEAILAASATLGLFVRIEMESADFAEPTLRLFKVLRERHDNVGTVIQAYLYRSRSDLESLWPLKPDIRFVKGAYREPASVAYPRKGDVDRNFRALVNAHLDKGLPTAVATHDERIIEDTLSFIRTHGFPNTNCTFEMLYGIRIQLQHSLLAAGQTVRIYVPFGRLWYPYFMRRIAERPANLFFLVRSLLTP